MEDFWMKVVTICCCFFGLFYLWAKWKLSYWQRRGVPSVPGNIFFGNFTKSIFLREAPGLLLGRLHREAPAESRFLGVYILQKPFLFLRDPKLVKHMFIKDFDVFANRHFSVRNERDLIGSSNLFSIDNPEWRYLRQKLSPSFSSAKVKDLFNLMVESSEALKSYLDLQFKENPKEKKTIDLKDVSMRYTADVISSLAFGIRTNSFDKATSDFYDRTQLTQRNDLFTAVVNFIVFFFPRVRKLPIFPVVLGEQRSYFRNLFWNSMKAREEAKLDRGDVIDNLLKLKNEKEDGPFKFKGDVLLAQSAVFFFAGFGTSSTTIVFALWELAQQQDIQDRVRQEIIDKLEEGGVTYANVQQMKYLMQVINETLRLYPPAPVIDRVAEKDYKIPDSDVIIEKGTAVYVVLPGIQRDPQYFPNPDKFDPDRFDEGNKIEPYTFMPFGEGPRICIGMKIGLLQTAVGLIRILRNYRVSVNPSYKAAISKRHVFVRPQNGAYLYCEKLSSI